MVDIYDPIEKLFKKRYESLSDETKHRLKKLDNICSSIYQPKLIKRKRPKLCRGDVFVMNLFEGIYFYGVVLNTGIDDSFMGRNLVSVCILKKYSKGMTEFLKVESLKTEDILIRPSIISVSYTHLRHPDSVGFTRSLEEDLKRRDFTVNALVMDENGSVTDILGASEDLRNHVLRAVGDPDERFREDSLRIMRAMRFASVLGFRIEEKTEAAMFRNGGLLKKLSVERVFSEFRKLVTGKYAPDVVDVYKRQMYMNIVADTITSTIVERMQMFARPAAFRFIL